MVTGLTDALKFGEVLSDAQREEQRTFIRNGNGGMVLKERVDEWLLGVIMHCH